MNTMFASILRIALFCSTAGLLPAAEIRTVAELTAAAASAKDGTVLQLAAGTYPLTATWWRGALYGAFLGLMFGVFSGRN